MNLRRTSELGRIGRFATLLLSLAALWPTQAAAAGEAALAASTQVPAATWIARIRNAAASLSYQGTLTFSHGGVVSSARVLHVCSGSQRVERIEMLDGRARLQYRHNDQMLTLWPAAKVAVAEPREPVAEFPALPGAGGLDPLLNYQLVPAGGGRIAGHPAELLLLQPKDGLRYAHRLWAHQPSGLLLRSDVLGPQGEVLESTAFSDLRIDGRLQVEPLLAAMKKLDGYRLVRPLPLKAGLEDEGWRLAQPVPGFQLVSCSKRMLQAQAPDGEQLQVLQSIFSDGLSHVSVFIEPYDGHRHKQPMRTVLGATHSVTLRQGDWWLTIVGEVPLSTVQRFETMLERKR